MKKWLLTFMVLTLAGCTAVSAGEGNLPDNRQPAAPALPNLGTAPELTNEVWLNTEKPLRLANLRGSVVLLEMWTFG